MTTEIQLTQCITALVDDEDFERVSQFKWCAVFTGNRWYAGRNIRDVTGSRRQLWLPMARFIMGLGYGDPRKVDHKNREATLDNRRSNLRITIDRNPQNQGKHTNNKSGFKGVSWHKATQKWRAGIQANSEQIYLGVFPTPELAANAYDDAALKYHDEFAVTNAMLGLLKKPAQSVSDEMLAAA